MIHCDSIRRQQRTDLREIRRKVRAPDMLEHAHAGDAIELTVDIPVILKSDFDPICEACFLHPLRRELVLLLGKRDAGTSRTEALRGADHQRAPAASDVEERLRWLQRDLFQDVIDLLLLSAFPFQPALGPGFLEPGVRTERCL